MAQMIRGGPAGSAKPAPPIAIWGCPSVSPIQLTTESIWRWFPRLAGPYGSIRSQNRAFYERRPPRAAPEAPLWND